MRQNDVTKFTLNKFCQLLGGINKMSTWFVIHRIVITADHVSYPQRTYYDIRDVSFFVEPIRKLNRGNYCHVMCAGL